MIHEDTMALLVIILRIKKKRFLYPKIEKMIILSLDEKAAVTIYRVIKLTLKYAKKRTRGNVRKTY